MADIRNDQYLHRPGAGRGAITPADPFEVILYDGSGNPLLVKKPTGETRQALGVAGYGYDGTNWRPVKVNASGQAEVQLTGSIPSFFPAQPAVITATLDPLAAGETRQLADVRAACVIEAITLIVPLNDVRIRWSLDRYKADQSTTIPYWQFVDNYAATPISGITMGQIKYAGGLFGFRFGTNASNEADIAQSVTPIYCPYGFRLRAVNTVTDRHAWGRAIVAYRVVS